MICLNHTKSFECVEAGGGGDDGFASFPAVLTEALRSRRQGERMSDGTVRALKGAPMQVLLRRTWTPPAPRDAPAATLSQGR